ncbi:MAG: response regulator [Ardenticatenaceae bacterium]|nr:response regulator [Ardenticatenaceae bacterium]
MASDEHILVIDDEEGIRRGCRRALEPQGFEVETAVSLQEGRAKLQSGQFALILLDVMLPDGRGIELLPVIHGQDPETIVIIVTGYATVELAVEAIKRGAYDFISKPFTADLLLMTVNQGLEKRRLSLETKRLQTIEQEAAELARARAEAERLSEFKSQFTTLVAHELRSPIGGAQSLLRTMNRGLVGELNEKQRDILGRVEARLDMLLTLVNDLLELASSKTMAPDEPRHSLSLRTALQAVVDRFAVEAAQKQITLTCGDVPESLTVQATESGLDRVFSNLISNAIKYTPVGGRVGVVTAVQSPRIRITITDTGIGIPAADLPHIWDEFYRAQNAKQSGILGTGLGLSIVRQLIESFGGSITVDSVEGKGTTFTLNLPVHPFS